MADEILPQKPNLDKVLNTKLQCILSNTFSASSDRSTAGVLVCLSMEMRLITRLVPSGACLFFINPTWSGLIKVGSTFSSLLASSLAYILMSEFRRDMVQKLAGVSGVFPGLGRVITVARSISAGTESPDMAWFKMLHKVGDRDVKKAL